MTEKERLKIIRETPHYFTCDVMRKDFLYLFEQSKQKQEYEDKYTAAVFDNAHLEQENKKLRKALEQISNSDVWFENEGLADYDAWLRCTEISDKALEEFK